MTPYAHIVCRGTLGVQIAASSALVRELLANASSINESCSIDVLHRPHPKCL